MQETAMFMFWLFVAVLFSCGTFGLLACVIGLVLRIKEDVAAMQVDKPKT